MTSLIFPTIFLIIVATTIGASAQEAIQLFDQTGNPVGLSNQPVQVLQLQQDQIYTGEVFEPTTVSGTVENLFTSSDNNGVTHFTFKVAPYQTELVIGQGAGQTTLLVEPQKSQLPYGITTTELVLLVVVVAVIVMFVWLVKRKLENS